MAVSDRLQVVGLHPESVSLCLQADRLVDPHRVEGGHGHCGRHGKPPCTVPISGTISLVPLALLAAVAAPAIMNRRRRVVTTKT